MLAKKKHSREYGCSKCRRARHGCARCRAPGFQERQRAKRLKLCEAADQHDHDRPQKRVKTQEKIHASQDHPSGPSSPPPSKFRRVFVQSQEDSSVDTGQEATGSGHRPREEGDDTIAELGPPTKFAKVEPTTETTLDEQMTDAIGVEGEPTKPQKPAGNSASFLEKLEQGMSSKRRHCPDEEPTMATALAPPPKRQSKAKHSPVPLLPVDPRIAVWHPPASPYGLIEEELYENPWKLLIACILLNKTGSHAVRNVIWRLFEMCPTPETACQTHTARIEELLHPLGLSNIRAVAIQRLSDQYLHSQWRDPLELFGVGKYAADAYHIFCRGQWRYVHPEDKDLKRYKEWLLSTEGHGMGFE